jgi:hypothetical protein
LSGTRRHLIPALLSILVGVVMLASRRGLLHVGYSSPALSGAKTLNDYGYTSLVLVEAVAGAFFLYLAYVVLSGPKNVPPAERGLLLGTLLMVVFVGGIWVAVRELPHHGSSIGQAFQVKPTKISPAAATTPAATRPPTAAPSFRWAEVVVFASVVAAVALVLAVAYLVRRRRAGEAPPLLRRETAGLVAALDRGVDDLRTEPDLRRAIIAAYARMEAALGSYRMPRERWETALEYLARVLVTVDASRSSVERLTHLFERAKFSNQVPVPPMRKEAIAALEAVRAELLGVNS